MLYWRAVTARKRPSAHWKFKFELRKGRPNYDVTKDAVCRDCGGGCWLFCCPGNLSAATGEIVTYTASGTFATPATSGADTLSCR